MDPLPRFPVLYEVNTRPWLTALSATLGRPATLDDVPDAELDRLAAAGFDWIWLLSVWQTGEASRRISRTDPGLRAEFLRELPDLREEDIAGSGFAITAFTVSEALGGDAALARLRERLADRGLRLMLDFVPNHTALDHPWVEQYPDRYVRGTADDLARAPGDYTRIDGPSGPLILAHGRDPYFPGWTDTLQLDYANPSTIAAMTEELASIAERCDGVRCDMSMLVLPEVFERTWGRPALPFWPGAIAAARARNPGFRLIAEVYWGLEWEVLQQGFDGAYDKRLYDRLVAGAAGPVRDHLAAPLDYQSRMVRFLENHDEPRAAAVFPAPRHEAAAIITFLAPGLRFLHQGQLEGHRVRLSAHLVRWPDEPTDPGLHEFYGRLLAILRDPALRDGDWAVLACGPAWDGNSTVDQFLAFAWSSGSLRWIVVVNFGPNQGQARVLLPFEELAGRSLALTDRATGAVFDRSGDDLREHGLYVDLPAWGYHLLEVPIEAVTEGEPAPPERVAAASAQT